MKKNICLMMTTLLLVGIHENVAGMEHSGPVEMPTASMDDVHNFVNGLGERRPKVDRSHLGIEDKSSIANIYDLRGYTHNAISGDHLWQNNIEEHLRKNKFSEQDIDVAVKGDADLMRAHNQHVEVLLDQYKYKGSIDDMLKKLSSISDFKTLNRANQIDLAYRLVRFELNPQLKAIVMDGSRRSILQLQGIIQKSDLFNNLDPKINQFLKRQVLKSTIKRSLLALVGAGIIAGVIAVLVKEYDKKGSEATSTSQQKGTTSKKSTSTKKGITSDAKGVQLKSKATVKKAVPRHHSVITPTDKNWHLTTGPMHMSPSGGSAYA